MVEFRCSSSLVATPVPYNLEATLLADLWAVGKAKRTSDVLLVEWHFLDININLAF